jgi:hypothetical protein
MASAGGINDAQAAAAYEGLENCDEHSVRPLSTHKTEPRIAFDFLRS